MRTLPRNDPRQYDDLAGEWWRPGGAFEPLHWLARARARLVPPASRPHAVLVDVGCGAGLLAPHLRGKGYRHIGVDPVTSALEQAATHGVTVIHGDVSALPLASGSADVVVAGELLEHVPDLPGAVAELCRVLRPGGRLVLDTLNSTALCRLITVSLAERIPGIPRGIHDPALYVDPGELTAACARHGVALRVRGLRPTTWGMLRWVVTRAGLPAPAPGARRGRGPGDGVRMVPVRTTAVLYQGLGIKRDGSGPTGRDAVEEGSTDDR